MRTTAEARGPGAGDRLPRLDVAVVPPLSGAMAESEGPTQMLRLPRMGRRTRVLFFPHGAACRECRSWLRSLLDSEGFLDAWGARVVAVVPGPVRLVARVGSELDCHSCRFTLTADPGRECRGRYGLGPEDVGLFVADRYGEIWYADRAARAGTLAGPSKLETRVRYLATQCPECGVPDEPGHGEWSH